MVEIGQRDAGRAQLPGEPLVLPPRGGAAALAEQHGARLVDALRSRVAERQRQLSEHGRVVRLRRRHRQQLAERLPCHHRVGQARRACAPGPRARGSAPPGSRTTSSPATEIQRRTGAPAHRRLVVRRALHDRARHHPRLDDPRVAVHVAEERLERPEPLLDPAPEPGPLGGVEQARERDRGRRCPSGAASKVTPRPRSARLRARGQRPGSPSAASSSA